MDTIIALFLIAGASVVIGNKVLKRHPDKKGIFVTDLVRKKTAFYEDVDEAIEQARRE